MRNQNWLVLRQAAIFLVLGPACGPADWASVGAVQAEKQEARTHRAALGVGVDYAETKTFRRCVTTPQTTTEHIFEKRLYVEKSVSNRSELDSSMNIDASASAKGYWGSGSGSFGYFKDVKMTSEAFYWLVFAEYKLRDEGIDLGSPDFHLTPDALAILNGPRGLKGFYEACGDYFYSATSLGAKYSLLYEFKSTEEKTIDKIRTGSSYSGWGVEAKASFEKLTTMAQKASVLDIHVETTGGGDQLRSYATSPEQLEEELKKLRDDLYTGGLGISAEWIISDYNMFPEVQAAKVREAEAELKSHAQGADLLAKDIGLENLYRLYHRNVDYHEQLLALRAAATSNEPLYGYGKDGIEKMDNRLSTLEEGNIAIAQAARRCIVGHPTDCRTNDLTRTYSFSAGSVKYDFPPTDDYTGLNGWTISFMVDKDQPDRMNFEGVAPRVSGEDPDVAFFDANWQIGENFAGIYAPARKGLQNVQIIGKSQMVRDPKDYHMRPYLCVYEYVDLCSLRIVPLAKAAEEPGHVKLQLVIFDEYGFITDRLDFPRRN